MSFQQIAAIATPNARQIRAGPPVTSALHTRPPNAELIRNQMFAPEDLSDSALCFKAIQVGFISDPSPHYWWMETKAVTDYCKKELIVKLNALLEAQHQQSGEPSRLIKGRPKGYTTHKTLIKWLSKGFQKDIKFQWTEYWVDRLERLMLTVDLDLTIHDLIVLISETYHSFYGHPPPANDASTLPPMASLLQPQVLSQCPTMLAPMVSQGVAQQPYPHQPIMQHPSQQVCKTLGVHRNYNQNTVAQDIRSDNAVLQNKVHWPMGQLSNSHPTSKVEASLSVNSEDTPSGYTAANSPAVEPTNPHSTILALPAMNPRSVNLINRLKQETWPAEILEPIDMVDEPLPPDPSMAQANLWLHNMIELFVELPPLFRDMTPPQSEDLSQLARCIRFAQSQSQLQTEWRVHPAHVNQLQKRCNKYGRELLRARTDINYGWPGNTSKEFWGVLAMRFAQSYPEQFYTAAFIGPFREEMSQCGSAEVLYSYFTKEDNFRFAS